MRRSKLKRLAAARAAEYVEDGWVVGVGSGSTVSAFLRELKRRVDDEGLAITVVPASSQTYLEAVDLGLRVGFLDSHPHPDADFDGADQVDALGYLVKGGGAALAREKVLASASKRFFVMVDESKVVPRIGGPIPIEVLPYALRPVLDTLRGYGSPKVRMAGASKNGPVVTDNGNYIVDLEVKQPIEKPEALEAELKLIPGVVEVGIFSIKPLTIIVGGEGGVEVRPL